MGGTFDVLHRGHRELLKRAFSVGRKVVIGITSDELVSKLHKPHKVDSFEKRKTVLERLLSHWGVLARTRIVALDDRFGPTIISPRFDAIVVSQRTLRAALEINSIRKAKKLKPLAIVTIRLIMADDSRPISSTRIRRGRINREGKLLHDPSSKRMELIG